MTCSEKKALGSIEKISCLESNFNPGNSQRQIAQARELSHRFGLNSPEEISLALRISIDLAAELQSYIEIRK